MRHAQTHASRPRNKVGGNAHRETEKQPNDTANVFGRHSDALPMHQLNARLRLRSDQHNDNEGSDAEPKPHEEEFKDVPHGRRPPIRGERSVPQ